MTKLSLIDGNTNTQFPYHNVFIMVPPPDELPIHPKAQRQHHIANRSGIRHRRQRSENSRPAPTLANQEETNPRCTNPTSLVPSLMSTHTDLSLNKKQDALAYLNALKYQNAESYHLRAYETFMSTLRDWDAREISTANIIAHITTAISGDTELILGFSSFYLPHSTRYRFATCCEDRYLRVCKW